MGPDELHPYFLKAEAEHSYALQHWALEAGDLNPQQKREDKPKKRSKSNRNCCVAMCTKSGYYHVEEHGFVSYHRFPRDEELRRKWIISIKRDEGDCFKITKDMCVCSLHFEKSDFRYVTNYSGRRYLKDSAVPSVFKCWESITTIQQKKSRFTNRLQQARDTAVPTRFKKFLKHLKKDKAGVSRAGEYSASSSVTDPIWSGQGKTRGKNQEVIGRGRLRSKKIKTEQNSSDECLDGNEPEVYIDVAEHPEDSRKRKHSLGDDEFLSVSDVEKYVKSEDGVGVKIEISQEYIFDETSGEQNIEKNMSDGKEFPNVNDGKTHIKSEYDVDVKTEISQEYLSVKSLVDQDTVKDRNEVDNVNLTHIKQEPDDEVIESNR